MPKLIEEGKVYIAESPLYEVTCKDQTYFAYNEVEMDEIKAELCAHRSHGADTSRRSLGRVRMDCPVVHKEEDGCGTDKLISYFKPHKT